MRKSLILLCCICSLFMLGQEEKTTVKYNENAATHVTSLKYAANSIKDLQTINFESITSIFADNKEDAVIKLIFEIDLKESKNKFKSSVTISGLTEELDSLIIRSEEIVKTLIRIAKKNEIN